MLIFVIFVLWKLIFCLVIWLKLRMILVGVLSLVFLSWYDIWWNWILLMWNKDLVVLVWCSVCLIGVWVVVCFVWIRGSILDFFLCFFCDKVGIFVWLCVYCVLVNRWCCVSVFFVWRLNLGLWGSKWFELMV